MSGKDLFFAIGQTDEKTAADNVSRFNKKPPDAKRAETVSNIFSGLKIAAAAVFIVGFALFMRYFAEKMKDPPINPAESGTGTAVYNTEPAADTEPASTEPPETDAQTEEPEPETDYELAGYLIKKLAVSDKNTDKSKEMWNTLLSLGGDALDYCADILNKTADDGEKVWAAKLLCVYVKDEISSYGENFMTSADFVDYDSDDTDCIYWYTMFKGAFRSAARKKEKTDVAKDTPVLYRILTRVGFDNYAYYPERHTAEENIERACQQKSFSPVNIYKYYDDSIKLSKDDRAQLYEIYKNGDDLHKALVGYLVYNYFKYGFYDDVADAFQTGSKYFEYIPTNYEQWRQVEFSDLINLAPESSAWLDTIYAAVKAEAAALCREEFIEYDPVIYSFMEEDGFDGYKPGKPDIAFRAHKTLKAAQEFYWAVNYGDTPEYFASERYWQQTTVGLNEFCDYFGRYIDRDTVKAYIKNTWGLKIEGDSITLRALGPQGSLSIDLRSAHVITQSGNRAVLAANVTFPDAMFCFTREMTFEVTEDDNGVHITGGSFVEKVLDPYADSAKVAFFTYGSYILLREGRWNDVASYLSTRYFRYDDIPEEYRYLVTDTTRQPMLTLYDKAPKSVSLNRYTSPDIAAELCKITPVYDGLQLHPENAKTKTEPAFEHGYTYQINSETFTEEYMTDWDVMLGMKIVKTAKDKVTVAFDLTVEENGKKKTKTYTLDLVYEILEVDEDGFENGYYRVTGGTFVTELIYGN